MSRSVMNTLLVSVLFVLSGVKPAVILFRDSSTEMPEPKNQVLKSARYFYSDLKDTNVQTSASTIQPEGYTTPDTTKEESLAFSGFRFVFSDTESLFSDFDTDITESSTSSADDGQPPSTSTEIVQENGVSKDINFLTTERIDDDCNGQPEGSKSEVDTTRLEYDNNANSPNMTLGQDPSSLVPESQYLDPADHSGRSTKGETKLRKSSEENTKNNGIGNTSTEELPKKFNFLPASTSQPSGNGKGPSKENSTGHHSLGGSLDNKTLSNFEGGSYLNSNGTHSKEESKIQSIGFHHIKISINDFEVAIPPTNPFLEAPALITIPTSSEIPMEVNSEKNEILNTLGLENHSSAPKNTQESNETSTPLVIEADATTTPALITISASSEILMEVTSENNGKLNTLGLENHSSAPKNAQKSYETSTPIRIEGDPTTGNLIHGPSAFGFLSSAQTVQKYIDSRQWDYMNFQYYVHALLKTEDPWIDFGLFLAFHGCAFGLVAFAVKLSIDGVKTVKNAHRFAKIADELETSL